MIDAIRDLDPRLAAGILAQAALKIDGHNMPVMPLVQDQDKIENSILDQLRLELHLQPADWSEGAIAKLADALDQQTELLGQLSQPDYDEQLSVKGSLPSDVYNIQFSPQLAEDFGWRWNLESTLALQAIRGPHLEQVLGGGGDDPTMPLVTVFARFYNHRFPARSFWLLVLAERSGKTLRVMQVWRVYPIDVDLSECESLLDVLRAFSEKFGHPVEIRGQRGKFFFRANTTDADQEIRKIKLNSSPTDVVTMTWFNSKDRGTAFLVVPIRLTAYFKCVEKWNGWDKDILHELGIKNSSARTAAIG